MYTQIRKNKLTTLYDGSEAQVTCRADAMDHKDKVVHLFWFTWEHTQNYFKSKILDFVKLAYIPVYFLLVYLHTYHPVFLQGCCLLPSWLFEVEFAQRARRPTHPANRLADTALSTEKGGGQSKKERKNNALDFKIHNLLKSDSFVICLIIVYIMIF